MPLRAAFALSLLGVVASAAAQDFAKARAYGEKGGDVDLPSDNDGLMGGACQDVIVSTPVLRVAMAYRTAKKEMRQVSEVDLDLAKQPALVVYYQHRMPEFARGSKYQSAKWLCTSSTPPKRIVLMGATDDQILESLEPVTVTERTGSNALGATFVAHGGLASFDLQKAMAMTGGEKMRIGVIFDGSSTVFTLPKKKLAKLTPDWAR